MLDHAQIEALIPHAGPMVLIDKVLSVDEDSILCEAVSHTHPENPLRAGGILPPICGAEYGAQAAAIHGPALKGEAERSGQVVLLRDIAWQIPDLSAITEPLTIRAECVHKNAGSLAYDFSITAGTRELIRGECGIILS